LPGYQARLVDCAEEAARGLLGGLGMGTGDIDLLVAAPSSPGFLDPLRVRLGIPGDRVAYVSEDLDGAYSAGPIAALQAAARSGRLAKARDTLLLAAGPGITVCSPCTASRRSERQKITTGYRTLRGRSRPARRA
jgi:3-oxoacyl-[acyl-carrier-protein] synthase III